MVETRIRRASRLEHREDALAIRLTVFVDELGVPSDMELDEHEDDAVHFVAYEGPRAVGTARLREYEPGVGKVERVAVLPDHRGTGLGSDLMTVVESAASEAGMTSLVLDAQEEAVGFYERLDYTPEGDLFDDAGIPHRRMRKQLG